MSIAEEIKQWKGGRTLPNIEQFNKEYEVKKHKIFTDRLNFPDRKIESEYTDEHCHAMVILLLKYFIINGFSCFFANI